METIIAEGYLVIHTDHSRLSPECSDAPSLLESQLTLAKDRLLKDVLECSFVMQTPTT